MTTDLAHMKKSIVLAGMPTLEEFVTTAMMGVGADGRAPDPSALAREWRVANDYYLELQDTEAGWIDESETMPLPESMAHHARAALDEPPPQVDGEPVPCEWLLIDLDRLAVFQKQIDVTYANVLRAALPTVLGDDDIVRLAIRPVIDAAPMQSARLSPTVFAFASQSCDLRFVDGVVLDPATVNGYRPRGRPQKMIGLFVGMSANYLSAVRFRNRLLLINGSHRAYVLRQLGVVRAPCLVYHLSREEDMDAMNMQLPEHDRELFFQAVRPPLFKDYFEPHLQKELLLPQRQRLMTVQVSVDLRHDVIPAD